MEAITFRAEPEFMAALRDYAERAGLSVNAALKEIVAPVIGVSKQFRAPKRPRNNLSRFSGTLTAEDVKPLLEALKDTSTIEEELWK